MKITSRLKKILQKSIHDFFDFIFPPQCPYCDKIINRQQILCDECFQKIHFITGSICYRCGRPLPASDTNEKLLCAKCLKKRKAYDMARSVFFYEPFSRFAILKLKNADRTDLRWFFVHFMLHAGRDLFDKTDIIIPVPLYWYRKAKRKYNQSAVLGELLAKKINKQYSESTLIKIRNTHSQEKKSGKERIKNVKDAFDVRKPNLIYGKTVLLIDDVLTTGATAESCAKTLKKHGAKAVYVLTIALSVHNRF